MSDNFVRIEQAYQARFPQSANLSAKAAGIFPRETRRLMQATGLSD